MIELIHGSWLMGDLGVINIPKNVKRDERSMAWRVTTSEGSFWEYRDVIYGSPYYSLKEAVRLAITMGSLPYTEACLYMGLIRKHRLKETGVTGVYYRCGLKESYKVIYNGSLVKIPYDRGKGFTMALRALEKLLDPTVEEIREQFKQIEQCSIKE